MQISVQTGGILTKIGEERCYEAIAKSGITAIDWNIDRDLPSQMVKDLNYKGISVFERSFEEVLAHHEAELAIIRKNGLTITQAHTPFPAYLPGHPELLDFMIGVYKNCIRLCDYAGCKNLIVHGISLMEADTGNTPETIEAMNWRLYEALIPTLQECDVVVCLENLFTRRPAILEGVCSDAHEAVRFIDALNEKAGKEAFGFCLDTGHLQLINKNIRTYIPILGKRIKALHLHDNDGRDDLHRLPLTGTVNWQVLCDSLRAVGYDGDLSFETFRQNRMALDFDEELLLPFLEVTRKIGEAMARKIREE